jgi:predicted phosphoribosyltransferase
MLIPFRDRVEAGEALARKLVEYAGLPNVLVLALPRGGVPVAFEVAQALHAPLDVFMVRKLGVPGHEELAMGAVASGGVFVLNEDLIRALKLTPRAIQTVAERELRVLHRRERLYRPNRPPLDVRGRIVILVDDGLATGSTMRAAVAAVQRLEPDHVIVAAPIASPSTCAEFADAGAPCICVIQPEPLHAVGIWYDDFSQTTDDQVCDLLERAGVGTIAATTEH